MGGLPTTLAVMLAAAATSFSLLDPADEDGKTTRSKRLCLYYPGGTKKKLGAQDVGESVKTAAVDCAAVKY